MEKLDFMTKLRNLVEVSWGQDLNSQLQALITPRVEALIEAKELVKACLLAEIGHKCGDYSNLDLIKALAADFDLEICQVVSLQPQEEFLQFFLQFRLSEVLVREPSSASEIFILKLLEDEDMILEAFGDAIARLKERDDSSGLRYVQIIAETYCPYLLDELGYDDEDDYDDDIDDEDYDDDDDDYDDDYGDEDDDDDDAVTEAVEQAWASVEVVPDDPVADAIGQALQAIDNPGLYQESLANIEKVVFGNGDAD